MNLVIKSSDTAEKVRPSYKAGADKTFLSSLRIINTLPVLFWGEKFALLIDYFQLFSLLWITAQPWGLPFIFSVYSRPLLYFNLDFFSLTSNGAILGRSVISSSSGSKWGQMDGYLNYALYFAAAQFLLFALILLLILFRERRTFDTYGKLMPRYDRVELFCMYVSYLIYLPCSLAVFRLYYCESISGQSSVLSSDPNVSCSSSTYIVYVIVCSCLSISVFVGLPLLMLNRIRHNLIYRNSADHEKKIQIWEILHMLDIDSYWLRNQIWLFSSFKRSAAYFRPHMLAFKAVLLVISIGVRFDFIFQSTLFFCLSVLFFAYYCVFRFPYRSKSSNIMLIVILGMCVFNTAFGMMNAYQVQSAVVVASTQSYLLGLFNILGFLFIIAIVIISSAFLPVIDWPTMRTFRRITCSNTLLPKVSSWVDAIRESRLLQLDYVATPVEVADIQALEQCIRLLRKHWLVAKSFGSLFESILGERLEDLLLLHSSTMASAHRRYTHWDEAYTQAIHHQAFRQRKIIYATMTPLKRRILIKLLAIRYLSSSSGRVKLRKFDARIAAKYSKLLKEFETAMEKSRNQHKGRRKKLTYLGSHGRVDGSKGGGGKDRDNRDNDTGDGQKELSEEEKRILQMFDTGIEDPDYVMDYSIEHGLVHNEEFANFAWGSDGDADVDGVAVADGEPHHTSHHFHASHSAAGFHSGHHLGKDDFTPLELSEAAEMLATLKMRTEASLTKHHIASVNLRQWGGPHSPGIASEMPDEATGQHAASATGLTAHDSDRFTSFRVLKETVDQAERDELQELYLLWDEAIHLYESEEFPGDYEFLNQDAENWYLYRSILSERLELVMQLLAQKHFDFSEIEAAEVIEEDDDEGEEGEGEGEDGGQSSFRVDGDDDVDEGQGDGAHADIHEDDEEDDYDYDDVENQLRAKYHQSKKIPTVPTKTADTEGGSIAGSLASKKNPLSRSKSSLNNVMVGRPPSAQSASFDYDVFEGIGDKAEDFATENVLKSHKH